MQYSHDLHYTVSACQSQTVFLHFSIFPFYRFLLPVLRALHFFFLYTKEIFLSISPAARLVSASLPDLSILRGHNLLYFSCPFLAYILLCGYSHVFHPQLSTYPQIVDKLWITAFFIPIFSPQKGQNHSKSPSIPSFFPVYKLFTIPFPFYSGGFTH